MLREACGCDKPTLSILLAAHQVLQLCKCVTELVHERRVTDEANAALINYTSRQDNCLCLQQQRSNPLLCVKVLARHSTGAGHVCLLAVQCASNTPHRLGAQMKCLTDRAAMHMECATKHVASMKDDHDSAT